MKTIDGECSVALSELERYIYDLPDVSGETPFTTGYFLIAFSTLFKEFTF